MADFSIATSGGVPQGNTALANIATFDGGSVSDVTSITTAWYDQNGVLLKTLTRTTVDVSGNDIYGNLTTLSDPAGIGTYRATLAVDSVNYTPPTTGLRWSLVVTVVKGAVTSPAQVFYFNIIPTTLTIGLDATAVTAVVMRQVGIIQDVQHVANGTNANISLRSGPVYAIHAAYKNGVAMASPADYTWTLFRTNVTAVAAPAVNDHYTFSIQTKSDALVLDIVTRSIAEVRRGLRSHYTGDAITNSPTALELVKALAIGQLKQDMSEGTALDSAFYRSGRDLWNEAKAAIRRIQRGEESIYDSADAPVARASGSLVGGYIHPDGPSLTRGDRINQAIARGSLYATILRPGYWYNPEVWW